jgi:hypothetical protein
VIPLVLTTPVSATRYVFKSPYLMYKSLTVDRLTPASTLTATVPLVTPPERTLQALRVLVTQAPV